MRAVETKSYKEMKKLDSDRTDCTIYCKHCGHSVVFPKTSKVNKTICSNCGYYIFQNNLVEFKYRLGEKGIKNVSK